MRKRRGLLERLLGGVTKLAGAALLYASASGGCPGPGVGVNLTPAEIDMESIVRHDVDGEGKQEPICDENSREDLGTPVVSFTLRDDVLDLFQTHGAGVEIEAYGDQTVPFTGTLIASDSDNNGTLDRYTLYVKSDGSNVVSGDFRAQIRALGNVVLAAPIGSIFPSYTVPGIFFTGNGFDVDFKYHNCVPDEEEWYPGDGICEGGKGEHFGNSPEDCGNDGVCDANNGEDWTNSEDCERPCEGTCFTPGATEELPDNTYRVCEDPDGDGCFDWNNYERPGECTIGDQMCVTDNSMSVCSDDDGDGRGFWSDPAECFEDHFCQDGDCVFDSDASKARMWTAINYDGTANDPISNPAGHNENQLCVSEGDNVIVSRTYMPVVLRDYLEATYPGSPLETVAFEEHGYTGPGDTTYIMPGSVTGPVEIGEFVDAEDGRVVGYESSAVLHVEGGSTQEETLWTGARVITYTETVNDTEKATPPGAPQP